MISILDTCCVFWQAIEWSTYCPLVKVTFFNMFASYSIKCDENQIWLRLGFSTGQRRPSWRFLLVDVDYWAILLVDVHHLVDVGRRRPFLLTFSSRPNQGNKLFFSQILLVNEESTSSFNMDSFGDEEATIRLSYETEKKTF